MPDFSRLFRRQEEIPQDLSQLPLGIQIKQLNQDVRSENEVPLLNRNENASRPVFEIDHAALKKTLAAHKHNLLALGKELCNIRSSETTEAAETTETTNLSATPKSLDNYHFNPMIVNIFRAMWEDDSEERIYKGEEKAFLESINAKRRDIGFDFTKNLCDIPESELDKINLTQEEFQEYLQDYLTNPDLVRRFELNQEHSEDGKSTLQRLRHLAMYVAPFRGSKFNKGYNFEDFHQIQSALEYLEQSNDKASNTNKNSANGKVMDELAQAIRFQDDIEIVRLQASLNALNSKTVSRDIIQPFLTPDELQTWDGCQTLASSGLGYFARRKNNIDIKNLVTAAQANCLAKLTVARHAHDVCETIKHATIETITNHRPNRFSKWFYGIPFAIGCGFMIFSSVLIAAAFALLAYPLAILMGNATTYVNSAITRIVPESTMNLGKKRFFGKRAGGLRWYHDAVTGQLRTRTGTRKWIFIATFIPVTATSICVGALTFYLMGWEQLKLSVLLKPLVFAMTKGSFAATATTMSILSYAWLILVVSVVTIGSVAAFTALLIDAWNALLQKHTSSLELEIKKQELRSDYLTHVINELPAEDYERIEAYQTELHALRTSINENNQRLNTRNPFKLFKYALNDLIKAKYQGQIQENARRIKNETTAAIWLMPVGIAVCLLGVGGTVYTGYVALKFLAPALFAWMGPVLPVALIAIGILSFIGQGPSFYMRNCMKFYVKVIGAISDLIAGSSNHADARNATVNELQQDGANIDNPKEASPEDNSLIGVDEFGRPVLDPNYALTASQRFWNWLKAKFGIVVAIVNAAGNGALTIPSVRANIGFTNHPVATSVVDNSIIGSATLNSLQAYIGAQMTDAEYKKASRRAGAQTNAVAAAICGDDGGAGGGGGGGNKPGNGPAIDAEYHGQATMITIAKFKRNHDHANNVRKAMPDDDSSTHQAPAGVSAYDPSKPPAIPPAAPFSAAPFSAAGVRAPGTSSSTGRQTTATPPTHGMGYGVIAESLSDDDVASPGGVDPTFGIEDALNPSAAIGMPMNPALAGARLLASAQKDNTGFRFGPITPGVTFGIPGDDTPRTAASSAPETAAQANAEVGNTELASERLASARKQNTGFTLFNQTPGVTFGMGDTTPTTAASSAAATPGQASGVREEDAQPVENKDNTVRVLFPQTST